jgi:hypothetical protein
MIHQQGSWITFLVRSNVKKTRQTIEETPESIKEEIEGKRRSRPHKEIEGDSNYINKGWIISLDTQHNSSHQVRFSQLRSSQL